MKIMVASDIHGSGKFAEKLVAEYEKENPDKLLLLGDILYHGPRNALPDLYDPKKVIELLNPLSDKILAVRGNCDSEVDQMVLDFPIMADYCLLFAGGRSIFATHGHHFGENNPPEFAEGSVLLCGHTHVPKLSVFEKYIYMNPGSVSIPKESSAHGYMTVTDEKAEWKTLEGKTFRIFDMKDGKEINE